MVYFFPQNGHLCCVVFYKKRDFFLKYRPSPVKLYPLPKTVFCPQGQFRGSRRDNLCSPFFTPKRPPLQYEKLSPLLPYCPPLTFSPRGDNFTGEGRYGTNSTPDTTTTTYLLRNQGDIQPPPPPLTLIPSAMPSRPFDLLLCSALHTGHDGGEELPLGDAVHGRNAATAELVLRCHDLLRKDRCRVAPMTTDEARAGTTQLSIELFHAYKAYTTCLSAGAGSEDLKGAERTLYNNEFGSRLWCLLHSFEVDGRAPAAGYVEFFRGMKSKELLPMQHITQMLERALAQLPSIAQSLLLGMSEELHLVSRLYLTLEQSLQIQDPAVQSQVALVAADFSEWVMGDGGVSFERFVVGLAKLGRTNVLHEFLVITRNLGMIGGLYNEASGPIHELMQSLIHFTSAHAQCFKMIVEGEAEATSRFAEWVAMVKPAYQHFWDPSTAYGASLKQLAQESSSVRPFVGGLLSVFDCLVFSQDLLAGEARLDWKEALSLALLYMAPQVTLDQLAEFISGERNLFMRMGMGSAEIDNLPQDDLVILHVLNRRVLDLLALTDVFNVPGLVAHMLEVVARVPDIHIPQATCDVLRDRSFAAYASEIYTRSPAYWELALDYCAWGGGVECRAVLCNVVASLDVSPQGVDHVIAQYDIWRQADADGVVLACIKAMLAAHGHRAVRRGLVVEGVKRLFQAGDCDAVEDHVEGLVADWALSVVEEKQVC